MATAAVYSAIRRVKFQASMEQAKRDLAMAKYERRLTRMENRQLNLLEDLENYEAIRNTEHTSEMFKASLTLRASNPTLSTTINNYMGKRKNFTKSETFSPSAEPLSLMYSAPSSAVSTSKEETAKRAITKENGPMDQIVTFEDDRQAQGKPLEAAQEEGAANGNARMDKIVTFEDDRQTQEEEQMKGSKRNSEFDTMSWIKKNGDSGYLSDLSFLKDLKEKKLPSQEKVRVWYLMRVTQIAVAVFIILNFLLSAVKAQRQPQTQHEIYVFEILEIIFAFIFAFELAVNMYGSWCRPFFESGWNWFDLIIVLISLFTLGLGSGIPGINTLRLFRAFRVIRLFKRIPSLKRIVEGVIQAIPGVSNALIVLIMIMSIWSILGVEFYAKASPENFGTFSKGMFSMFQCMTLDSWSGIARPLLKRGPMHWFFFCSYVLIAGIIMVNVVVAVLLEKFIGATGQKWIKKKAKSIQDKGHPDELAIDDMMMDRLLFLEMEFVRVNDKLDALISCLLDEEGQKGLQEDLERERSMSFLRTRTGKLAMHRARKRSATRKQSKGVMSPNGNWFIRGVDENY